MVKLLGITFAALFICAHLADVEGDAYHRPLSMFRDYEPAWIGYALFGLLVSMGALTIFTACRVKAEVHAVMYLVMTTLLSAVAITPSYGATHNACALVGMVIMYIYYAVLLYRGDHLFWFVIHLLAPSFLLMASHVESYGIWQKGMIVYFLVAATVHEGVLAQWLPNRRGKRSEKVKAGVARHSM